MDAALSPDPISRRLRVAAAAIAVLGGALVVAAILASALNPPRLTPKTLTHSVERETGSAAMGAGRCRHLAGRAWRCEVDDRAGSGVADYAVTMTSGRCWTARRTGLYGEPIPRTASGCLR